MEITKMKPSKVLFLWSVIALFMVSVSAAHADYKVKTLTISAFPNLLIEVWTTYPYGTASAYYNSEIRAINYYTATAFNCRGGIETSQLNLNGTSTLTTDYGSTQKISADSSLVLHSLQYVSGSNYSPHNWFVECVEDTSSGGSGAPPGGTGGTGGTGDAGDGGGSSSGSAGGNNTGSIQLSGTISFSIVGDYVTLTASKLSNTSTTSTTGTLYLTLWATSQSAPAGNGYTLGKSQLGQLSPNYAYTNISQTVAYAKPPCGAYYIHLLVEEYPVLNTIKSSGTFPGTMSLGCSSGSVGASGGDAGNNSGGSDDASGGAAAVDQYSLLLLMLVYLVIGVQRRIQNRN